MSVGPYLSEVSKTRRLTAAEETAVGTCLVLGRAVIEHCLQGSMDPTYRLELLQAATVMVLRAQEALVVGNLRLVVVQALRVGSRGRMGLEDIIQHGNQGLLRAALNFDPTRGVRFASFAWDHIRHAISKGRSEESHPTPLSPEDIATWRRVEAARTALEQQHERPPVLAELVQATGLSVEVIQHTLIRAGQPLPWEPSTNAAGEVLDLDALTPDPITPAPDAVLEAQDFSARVESMLAGLPKRESDILKMHFGINEIEGPLSISAIAQRVGLGKTRTRQLLKQALRKLALRPEARALMSELKSDAK